jgi:hypothetical protein
LLLESTNVARNVRWGVGAGVAGLLMQMPFQVPLLFGGTAKIIYDLLLYRSSRQVKPAEEGGAVVS